MITYEKRDSNKISHLKMTLHQISTYKHCTNIGFYLKIVPLKDKLLLYCIPKTNKTLKINYTVI